MRFLLVTVLFAIAADQLPSGDEIFKRGEQLYEAGKYQLAADTLKLSVSLFEKANRPVDQVRAMNLQAESLSNLNQCDAAVPLLQRSLEMITAQPGDNRAVLAETYYYLSRNTGGCARKWDDAIKLMQRSLAIKKEIYKEDHPEFAVNYTFLGYVYNSKGKYDSALIYLDKAMSIRQEHLKADDIELSHTMFNLAASYEGKSQLSKALGLNLAALKIRTAKLGNEHATVSNSINAIGRIYRKLGNNERALEYYRQALDIRKKTLGENHPNVAASYYEIGNLYGNISNYNASLEYIHEGNRILESNTQVANDVLPTYIAYEGKMHGLLGRHDEAKVMIQKAVAAVEKKLAADHPYRAIVYNIAGEYYGEAGDVADQSSFFKKAIAIYQKSYGAGSEREGDVISKMAATNAKTGNTTEANKLYRQALAIYTNKLGELNPKVATTYLGLGDHQKALASIAGTENKPLELKIVRGLAQTERTDTTAIAYYRRALDLIDDIARGYNSEAARIQLEKEKREICEDAMKVAWARTFSQIDGSTLKININEYLLNMQTDVFSIVENSKASLLLENAKDQWAKTIAGVPDSVIQKERDARIELEYYKNNLYQSRKNKDTAAIAEFEKNIFASERQLEQIKSQLETNFASYYKLKYNSPAVTLRDLMQQLPENTMVLQYFVTDENVYIIRVSHERTELGWQERKAVEKEIANYQKSLTDARFIVDNPASADSLYVATARRLFFLLGLPGWVGKLPEKMIIVPDDILGQVNFGTLLFDPHDKIDLTRKVDYPSLPYASSKYDFSYAYSATFLTDNFRALKNSNKNSFAGFAPSYKQVDYATVDSSAHPMTALAMRSGNLPLPGATEEVNLISKLMNGKSWVDEDATETNFKKYSGDYGVLHLAMHSLLNDEEPRYSELLFNHNKDTENDGYLTVAEIYNLKLNARMVVLSSCSSGFGKIQFGEGPISLSRAFSYAGCPSVVMSLWKVPDLVTTKIMKNFYENLSDGQPKDEALKQAQLSFIEENTDPLYKHPYYWAGFVVIGDTSPIDSSSYVFYLLGGLAVVVVGVLVFV